MNHLFPVVILAGGLATRLYPLTQTVPKSLITVNGEPFIAHQLRLLRQQQIRKVILCIGFLGEQIHHYVGNGKKFDIEVQYVDEGTQLLGTGGAIKKALPYLDNNFFILYGDSYLVCDYLAVQKVFQESDKMALMTVYHNKDLWDKSNIHFNHGKIITYDKKNLDANMHYIDYGLGVMNKKVFEHVSSEPNCDLAEIYQSLLKKDNLAAYEIKQRFYEIGSFQGIQELVKYLKQPPHIQMESR